MSLQTNKESNRAMLILCKQLLHLDDALPTNEPVPQKQATQTKHAAKTCKKNILTAQLVEPGNGTRTCHV